MNKKKGCLRHLMIEPTNRCQLRCPTCFSHRDGRPKHDMTFAQFRSIIDKNRSRINGLSLYNYGEPLLHAQICEMIAYAKTRGIRFVKIATNGLNLNETLSRRLVTSGLDYLSISLDGASAKTYQRFRKNGRFLQIVRNIGNLIRWRNKTRGPLKIEIQFIIMRHNEHEISSMRQLSERLKIDVLRFKTVLIKKKTWRYLLPENKHYNRYETTRTPLRTCQKPFLELVVNSDGTVIPCCYIVGPDVRRFQLGNIFKNTIDEILSGSAYGRFLKAVQTDKSKLSCCKDCREGELTLDFKRTRLRPGSKDNR